MWFPGSRAGCGVHTGILVHSGEKFGHLNECAFEHIRALLRHHSKGVYPPITQLYQTAANNENSEEF